MNKLMFIIPLLLLGSTVATADDDLGNNNQGWNWGKNNVELYFTGAPQPNTYNSNGFKGFPSAINKFCNENSCGPTTQFPLIDPVTSKQVGYTYVWGANYIYGANGSLCFTEIIKYDLKYKDIQGNNRVGSVYTLGDNGGTCGAFTDPTIVKVVGSKYGSVVVVVGGGGGTGSNPADAQGIKHGIVGATGDFAYLNGGSYIDRVFVEFSSSNTITYYNGLFFGLIAP